MDKLKLNMMNKEKLKKIANGKSSKDCTLREIIQVSRKAGGLAKKDKETDEQHLERVNAFRCGW